MFLNSNLPEFRYKIFHNKEELNELSDDSTDIFQGNMYRYTEQSVTFKMENFRKSSYYVD